MANGPKLALGTVQFGLAYGISGAAQPVPESEIARIFAVAREAGITRLDTAPAYGDIEERLGALAQGQGFEIVSKVAALPAGIQDSDLVEKVRASIETSRERLGDMLAGIIFHNAEDARHEAAWTAAEDATARADIPLGASHYDPAELHDFARRPAYRMAQVPGNAFDQRIAQVRASQVEVTMRSAFLQGLLLMPQGNAAQRLPAATDALEQWHRWCGEHDLPPLVAALSIVKGFDQVDFCVVGVDSAAQLAEIAAAWSDASPMQAPELAVTRPDITDPREWRTQA